MSDPSFTVVDGPTATRILNRDQRRITDIVSDTYRLHQRGKSVNPDSYFLRFPERPGDRIIALPARLEGERDIASIKWISSFPENHERNLPRASAVIVLNDMQTGFPIACLEGSAISAARTAASAALGARLLSENRTARGMAIIGTGLIARTVIDYLLSDGWVIDELLLFDAKPANGKRFASELAARGHTTRVVATSEEAIAASSLVLFATTSSHPYLNDPSVFSQEHTVLHLSLRDLGIPVVRSVQNVVDDIEHGLKAETSMHLTSLETGNRTFIDGTIADLIACEVEPDYSRPRVFSPFGLGVLDLAVADYVLRVAQAEGAVTEVANFFNLHA